MLEKIVLVCPYCKSLITVDSLVEGKNVVKCEGGETFCRREFAVEVKFEARIKYFKFKEVIEDEKI